MTKIYYFENQVFSRLDDARIASKNYRNKSIEVRESYKLGRRESRENYNSVADWLNSFSFRLYNTK